MIQAVLFDLDGTLADTARDLGGALNTLLRRHGLPEKSPADIRPLAGQGAGTLVSFGFGIAASHPEHETLRQQYLAEYQSCSGRDTVLFPQTAPLIANLHARGIRWGIVTNKHARFTDALVPQLGFPRAARRRRQRRHLPPSQTQPPTPAPRLCPTKPRAAPMPVRR